MCGKQSLCEHVLFGKLAAGGACRDNRFRNFHHSGMLSAGASMRLLANRLPAARSAMADCVAPPFGCRKAPSGSISWDGTKRKPVRQARGECAFTYWQGQLIASRAGGGCRLHIPGIRARNVEGHGQTWGRAPYPLAGSGKAQKGSVARCAQIRASMR